MAGIKDLLPGMAINGLKIDPLSEIRNAGIVTNGSVVWVRAVADDDYPAFQDAVGAANIRNTPQAGVDALRSDKNDYVMVVPQDAGAVWALGTALDLNEDRLHVLSVGYTRNSHGYSNTLRGFVSADGLDTSLVDVTASGVELAGFNIRGTSGTAAGGTISGGFLRVGTAASGTAHDLWVHDCVIENTQAAAAGGTTDLVAFSGDVATGIRGVRFERTWIGNWNWAGVCVRMGGTAGPARTEFSDCTFVMDAQVVGDSYVVLGTGVTEYTTFEDCRFINVEAGTANTSALTGAVLVDNPVMMINCHYLNATQAGTDTEVFKTPVASGTSAAVVDYGIALGTAAVSPV